MVDFIFSKDYETAIGHHESRPARLYKYRSLRGEAKEFSKALLTNGEVYFARPAELNDPYDCQPHNTMESTAAERRAFLTWVTKGREPELSRSARRARVAQISGAMRDTFKQEGYDALPQRAYESNLRDTGVLSLSAESSSNLMWSHYADAHRGICIELDFDALQEICPMPVAYSSVRPSVNVIRDVAALSTLAFLRKSSDWGYEKEWRSVGQWWSGIYRLPKNAVVGVVLGAAIANEDRENVVRWAQASPSRVAVSQAYFEPKSYRLAFSPIL